MDIWSSYDQEKVRTQPADWHIHMRDEMGNWDDLLASLCPCVTCGRLVCFRWNMVSTWHVFPSETYFLSSKYLASLFIFDIFFLKKWHSFLLWVWVWVASRNAFLLRSPARHRAGNRKSQQFAFFHQWGPRLSASATAPCGPSPGSIPWGACSFPWWSTPGGGLPAGTHLASASLGRHSQPPETVASSSALAYLLQHSTTRALAWVLQLVISEPKAWS